MVNTLKPNGDSLISKQKPGSEDIGMQQREDVH